MMINNTERVHREHRLVLLSLIEYFAANGLLYKVWDLWSVLWQLVVEMQSLGNIVTNHAYSISVIEV